MIKLSPTFQRILEAAVRSPSGDNCQPWSFKLLTEDSIRVTTDPHRAESFFDFKGSGTFLSLGAVIENIRTQAANESLGVEVDYNEHNQGESHSVVLHFTPVDGPLSRRIYTQAMLERTVNRRPYLPKKISDATLNELLADGIDNVGVSFFSNISEINRWSRLVYLADRIRYSHPQIHQELFSKIVYETGGTSSKGIGLEIDRLGAGPAAKLIMKSIEPWNRMQRLTHFGVDRLLAGQSRFLTLASGSLCLLTIESSNRVDWIRAGEQMERLWINIHHLGLCSHPVTVALYLDQRYQDEGMKNFLPKHQPALDKLREEIGTLLGNRTGAILFRIGKGVRMKSTAIRMPLENFIT